MDVQNLSKKYLDDIQKIRSQHECDAYLRSLTSTFSIKYYWYMTIAKNSRLVDCNHTHPGIIINNYPKEFTQDYLRNGRFAFDPVVQNSIAAQEGILLWDDLFNRKKLDDKHSLQLEWAASYNVENGVSVMIDHLSYLSMLHLVLPKTYDHSAATTEKQLINSIFPIAYLISKQLDRCTQSRQTRSLSARETQCLEWAARGKTIEETAAIVGLKSPTIREYLTNATRKLGAANKTEAVVKAALTDVIEKECLLDFWKP